MINAYKHPEKDGWYILRDGIYRKHETYHNKEVIKKLGGHWNAESKHWEIREGAIESIPAYRMYLVKTEPSCHCSETNPGLNEPTSVNELEIEKGFTVRGCLYCDTPISCGKNCKITEIIKEL